MNKCGAMGLAATLVFLAVTAAASAAEAIERPRVIVTTDGEVDDRCSMNRFLLYANDWDIRGLIHSSSKHHWKGNTQQPGHKWNEISWLDEQLAAYEAVYPLLKQHAPGYPTADELRSQVFVGNIELEGDMREATPGSNRIVEVLLEKDPSPVWLQAWGGVNTIARALKTIEEKYPNRVEEVSAKAKIYLITHQDNTYDTYIRKAWPNVEVLLSNYPSFGAIAYGWGKLLPPDEKKYFGRVWMRENLLKKHGPLLDLYEHKELRFRSEGDSPAFLHVINTGLRSDEHPTYGGWGGRFYQAKPHLWRSVDGKQPGPHSISRWAIEFQNDWAARADWCVKDYEQANHHPVVTLRHEQDITASPGANIMLEAEASDPDGDTLQYQWWPYQEAGTYPAALTIENAEAQRATFRVPDDAQAGQTMHLVCTVSDNGSPPLKKHRRVIVTCGPE
ncbi:hypothetical protein CA54_18220 [Symmachiella macrocystis]|uniref:DUF1593 domain-containing protein n=1 Tax=Symmachiella macrocystis TaxID=2527985 RepID=A0A5C6BNZ9_9PLAN|nr:DUF1593 domain-containing protein [Symmachiella macrocystis]TWU12996.1 hypothetical protein CA54_18220 [Symmachiella macrocystis]